MSLILNTNLIRLKFVLSKLMFYCWDSKSELLSEWLFCFTLISDSTVVGESYIVPAMEWTFQLQSAIAFSRGLRG